MALDQVDIDKLDIKTKREKEMSFIDHLEELRWMMIRSILGIVIMTILVFAFKKFFIDYIIFGPAKPDFIGYKVLCSLSQAVLRGDTLCFSNTLQIQNLSPSGQFMQHFQVSFILGFVLAFPWVFWQIWLFIKPALKNNEQHAMRGLTLFAWLFFILGILFGYLLILPVSLNFLVNYNLSTSIENFYHLKDYMSYITMVTVSSGIMFELPMVIFILTKIGLVTPQSLREQRKVAFLIIVVVAAIVTPPDIGSMFLITVPVYALYELSVFVSDRVYRKKLKEEEEKTSTEEDNKE